MNKKTPTLQPFEFEKATVGDNAYVDVYGFSDVVTFIYGPDADGEVCVSSKNVLKVIHKTNLYKNPICWVEDMPVYQGDVLYFKSPTDTIEAAAFTVLLKGFTEFEVILQGAGAKHITKDSKNLTWSVPKKIRKGWINIYTGRCSSKVVETKEKADMNAYNDRVDCIEITWSE